MNLTPKQKAFVDQYLIDLNGTQAAIRAGYSEASARQIADENMSKPHIQAEIVVRMKERELRTRITQDRVLTELAKIAFGNQANLMTWRPAGVIVKDSSLLNEDVTATVQEITETKTLHGGSIKVKTHDKTKALELIGRHLGMWKDSVRNEHSFVGPDGEPVKVTINTVYVAAGERNPS